MSNVLEVRDLTYSYDGVVNAVQEVSLDVPAGRVVGLIGPNGSGKSTLIRNVFDLLKAQSGRITVNGHRHTTIEAKRDAVYLASNDYLPEFLSPREYYTMLGKLYGVRLDHERARAYFRDFSMPGRYDDLIAGFSHGMRKKTQLVGALVLRRPLTVIDETLNGVDLEAMRLAERELRTLQEDGRAVLLCSHDLALLERLTDDVVFLDLGVLVLDGPTRELVREGGSLEQLVFAHIESEAR